MTGARVRMNSLVIPVYKNEANLDRLLAELVKLAGRVTGEFEVVFVVDGSPDRCLQILRETLPSLPLRTQLLSLSRNFGSFAAIAAGLERARGDCMAVMAADLQEPPELVLQFFEVLGSRRCRYRLRSARRAARTRGCPKSHPTCSGLSTGSSWSRTCRAGGVDMFGCTREVRDRLLQLQGIHSNLIALLVLARLSPRVHCLRTPARASRVRAPGRLARKLRYGLDSIFNFTDLPIQLLLWAGADCAAACGLAPASW